MQCDIHEMSFPSSHRHITPDQPSHKELSVSRKHSTVTILCTGVNVHLYNL